MQLFTKTTSYWISRWKRFSFSSVLSLVFACSPTTIIRFVVTIIIYPFQCIIKWTCSHIRIKLFEGLQPLITDFNSTSTIPLICPMLWIYATKFHICPYTIFGLVRQIRTWSFSLTATRLYRTILQIDTFDHFNCSTVTLAFESHPFSGTDDIGCTFNYNKFSKSLPSSIYKFHRYNYNNIPTICQGAIV